jgi:hypothetical protein
MAQPGSLTKSSKARQRPAESPVSQQPRINLEVLSGKPSLLMLGSPLLVYLAGHHVRADL